MEGFSAFLEQSENIGSFLKTFVSFAVIYTVRAFSYQYIFFTDGFLAGVMDKSMCYLSIICFRSFAPLA